MPKQVMDYSKNVIYRIVCNDLDVDYTYVGSTTNLNKRRYQHKYRCNTEGSHGHTYKVYQTIRENGGFDNWQVIEVENSLVMTLMNL